MSMNSAGDGAGRFSRTSYGRELAALKDTLANAEVVGWPTESVELHELERLVRKYPDQAREFLGTGQCRQCRHGNHDRCVDGDNKPNHCYCGCH